MRPWSSQFIHIKGKSRAAFKLRRPTLGSVDRLWGTILPRAIALGISRSSLTQIN